MRSATVLHTADVHLGTGTAGEDGYEERSFARAIDLAIDANVDAVLVAGDLFDHARVSEDLLGWTAKQLDRAERPVILLIEHERNFRPMAGIPPKPPGKWGIVAAHGLVLPDEGPTHHGSPITPSELAGVEWDYVALGHLHGHRILQESPVLAVYPGATARSLKGEPGVVLVSFAPESGTTFEWVALTLE
jgi:DNA repair protein SbcD/Mre11